MSTRDASDSGSGGCLRALVSLALVAGWAALLLSPYLRSPAAPPLELPHSLAEARAALVRVLGFLLLDALRFAPLGFFSVYVFRDRGFRLARAALVALPALLLGGVAAFLALWARDRSVGAPGPSDLLLPLAGVAAGVLVALASRRGVLALLLLPVKLAAAAALALALAAALLLGSLEAEASVPLPRELRSEDRREVVAAFRGKDPRSLGPGETCTLTLRQQGVDNLLAWALPLVRDPRRVRLAIALDADESLRATGSLRLPLVDRWLNVAASARVAVRQGALSLRSPRLRVGPRELPPFLMDALSPALERGLRAERRLRPLLAAVRETRIERGGLSLSYGRLETPPGLIASLVWSDGQLAALREAVSAQVGALLAALSATPRGDQRFARAYETAFALARERSRSGSAVAANRAAILGLGIVLGSARLAPFAGDALDHAQDRRAASLRDGTTVRGRADWTRHFSVSGALTVLSAVAPSNSAGLLKEELDADGGSGFSFGDLLADRAGTTFATVATRDEDAAAAIQRRLAGGFEVDAFFPRADGLPEDIQDAELRTRYGGVGGAVFERYADDVERRVRGCAAYR